ncbi:MAG: RluA family pseudouridine synthase [Phycisphaerae bacterium]|nr:RluA family pseudouridine synthase [Phycisphaerae bacterium]
MTRTGFEILFENTDLIAVNKPEGLAAIPEQNPQEPSLFERLCAERGETLLIVHRIDKDTSGVILFARHAEAHRRLNMEFETHRVRKAYLALVHGVIEDDWGHIDKPLARFGSGRVGVNAQHGKPSLTKYQVVRRLPAHTLLEAYPHTGRRHQIRVHLYSIGHAIVGDRLYGDRAIQRAYPRMMLHARHLTVRLPSEETITVEAPVPQSFHDVVDAVAEG